MKTVKNWNQSGNYSVKRLAKSINKLVVGDILNSEIDGYWEAVERITQDGPNYSEWELSLRNLTNSTIRNVSHSPDTIVFIVPKDS